MSRVAISLLGVLLAAPALAQTPAMPPITLAELETMALANNPTAAAAAAGVETARGLTRQAGAWPNPVVGYSGQEIRTSPGDRRGEHGFFVEQTIPLGGKLRLSREAFEKGIEQASAVGELQRLRILNSVRQAFYAVLLAERRVEVEERLAKLASEAVGVTAQLFNVGAADRPDFLEIEIEAQRVQLALDRARNELVALRHQLAAFTGVADVAGRPLAGSIDAAIPQLEREQVIRTLLAESPRLRAARAELDSARALTARAGRETAPDLFLRGGSDYNVAVNARTQRPVGWLGVVEAGLSIPLFDRNGGGVAAARANETRAQADLARLELSLRSEVESAFAAYVTARRASEMYRSAILPRAEEAYRLYLARYQQMSAAYPQVLVAQRTLFTMSAEYLQALDEAWHTALSLQSLLPGDGLERPE